MRLYHFTAREHLASIQRDGYLKLTDSNVGAPWEALSMPPVVWFLDVDSPGEWSHGLRGSYWNKTAVRITVDVPESWTLKWLDWTNASGIDDHWRDALVNGAGGYEAAAHWWVTFRLVRRDRWVEITLIDRHDDD